MRINLRSFGFLTILLSAVGFFLGLSTIPEFRALGLALMSLGFYLLYKVGEERKRLRKKQRYYRRVGRLIAEQLESV